MLGQYSKSDTDPNNFFRWFFGESVTIADRYRLVFTEQDPTNPGVNPGVCYLNAFEVKR